MEIFSLVIELQTSQSVRLKALIAFRNVLQKFYLWHALRAPKKWSKLEIFANLTPKTRILRFFPRGFKNESKVTLDVPKSRQR